MTSTACDLIPVHHPHAHTPRIVKLSRNIRRVIDMIAQEGKSLTDALQTVGITRDAYLKASRKPEFTAYQGEVMRVVRTHAAARTIAKAETLMDTAKSESVQADMTKWLAGLEGISPIAKSESVSTHKHLVAGLVIVRGDVAPPADDARVIDGQAHEVRKPKPFMRIGQPVPHPSMGNAQADEAIRAGNGEADQ